MDQRTELEQPLPKLNVEERQEAVRELGNLINNALLQSPDFVSKAANILLHASLDGSERSASFSHGHGTHVIYKVEFDKEGKPFSYSKEASIKGRGGFGPPYTRLSLPNGKDLILQGPMGESSGIIMIRENPYYSYGQSYDLPFRSEGSWEKCDKDYKKRTDNTAAVVDEARSLIKEYF